MPVAHPRGDHTGRGVGAGLVDERREQAGQQVDLDPLALARRVAVAQRGEDAGRREQAGEDVDERDADLLRLAVGLPVMLISPPSACTSRS